MPENLGTINLYSPEPARENELLDILLELYISSPPSKNGERISWTSRYDRARERAYYALDSWGLMGE